LRERIHTHIDPSSINVKIRGIVPPGKPISGTLLLVVGAVVPTFTVTDCVPLPLIGTEELDNVHVGAGVTDGVIAQLKLTVPVNAPVPANANEKLAVCPALMVCEVGDPEAVSIVKSGGP
jgi:hypothetical protein